MRKYIPPYIRNISICILVVIIAYYINIFYLAFLGLKDKPFVTDYEYKIKEYQLTNGVVKIVENKEDNKPYYLNFFYTNNQSQTTQISFNDKPKHSIKISPDKKKLSYYMQHQLENNKSKQFLIVFNEEDMSVKNYGEDFDWCYNFNWSLDSKMIAFVCDRNKQAELLVVDILSSKIIFSESFLVNYNPEDKFNTSISKAIWVGNSDVISYFSGGSFIIYDLKTQDKKVVDKNVFTNYPSSRSMNYNKPIWSKNYRYVKYYTCRKSCDSDILDNMSLIVYDSWLGLKTKLPINDF